MGAALSDTRTDRADDVLTLARLATRRRSVGAIMDWLALRTGGLVALVGAEGEVLATAPEAAPGTPGTVAAEEGAGRAALAVAARAVMGLYRRGTPSAVVDGAPGPDGRPGGAVHLVTLGADGEVVGAPYLAVIGPVATARQLSVLLADTARTLSLCWRIEQAERRRRQVEFAEAHSREAVLHLLMVGSVPAAQRIAGALGGALPDLNRVYVVECPGNRRREIAGRITRTAQGRAWIVPCPVRPNHLIALVSAEAETGSAGGEQDRVPLDRLITAQIPGCRVGVSAEVPLRDTPVGYEQAFHALAVARSAPEGCASFGRQTDITVLSTPEGRAWAADVLGPCLRYVPPRRADPGPPELLGTLGSWLSFGGAATRHLKIHRNTLAARMRLLDELLGLDLGHRLGDQSAAWLALQLHATAQWHPPAVVDGPAGLDQVLATPAAGIWARAQLAPLERARVTAGSETVRVWLAADARLPAAAAELGISLPGARKRLTKAEESLGRSLLRAPSAKYELWLAMRALQRL
ncbi:PucR family transcriptional regulator [Streptomyces palmae]|uniref:PucR family transcriptional regulator n=1 Tax=Streptomyces palmae TaxID=1701085 RepID=A0A4Z0G8P2_9ACTN|nr:helix-turn-helix domain-containing protein [Streptomyces palmae]TGA90944.1 PucR family transcriptional regulator [Streptomyces palmae]